MLHLFTQSCIIQLIGVKGTDMRNVYIVVAHDEKTEKKYVKIIKNKLEELGLAQFYSLHFTSAIIKKHSTV